MNFLYKLEGGYNDMESAREYLSNAKIYKDYVSKKSLITNKLYK